MSSPRLTPETYQATPDWWASPFTREEGAVKGLAARLIRLPQTGEQEHSTLCIMTVAGSKTEHKLNMISYCEVLECYEHDHFHSSNVVDMCLSLMLILNQVVGFL